MQTLALACLQCWQMERLWELQSIPDTDNTLAADERLAEDHVKEFALCPGDML